MKKPDRRKQRTRQLLRNALLELILEKEYDAITVTDISERANLGRATFYLHYESGKDQLFFEILGTMFDDLKQRFSPTDGIGLLEGAATRAVLFEHALEHRELYRATLLNQQGSAALTRQVRVYLAAVIQERIESLLPKEKPPLPVEVIAHYLAGALMALISWWLGNDTPYTADEMAVLFERLSRPTLESLMKTGDE